MTGLPGVEAGTQEVVGTGGIAEGQVGQVDDHLASGVSGAPSGRRGSAGYDHHGAGGVAHGLGERGQGPHAVGAAWSSDDQNGRVAGG